MDKFTLTVFSSVVFLAVVLLTWTYQSAGVKWKKRPWIPLWLGIGLLLTMFLFHWWLETVARSDLQLIEEHGNQLDDGVKGVLTSLSIAYARQAKFVELAVIPMAMALIGTALVLRIEREYSKLLDRIDEEERKVQWLQAKIRTAEGAVVDALTARVRGNRLLRLQIRVRSLKDDLLDQLETVRRLQRDAGLRAASRFVDE